MLYLAADHNITVNQFTFRRVLFIKCLFSNWKENTKCRSVRKPNEAARHDTNPLALTHLQVKSKIYKCLEKQSPYASAYMIQNAKNQPCCCNSVFFKCSFPPKIQFLTFWLMQSTHSLKTLAG